MGRAIKRDDTERRQTGIKLDTGLLKEFKVLAAMRETTLTELMEEAMRDYLRRTKTEV